MRFLGNSGRAAVVLLCAVLLGVAPAASAMAAGGMALAGTAGPGYLPLKPRAAVPPVGSRGLPQPGVSSEINGVFCTSRASCWAVGGFTRATGGSVNEALHWNGSRWSQVAVPSPRGFGAVLSAVHCTGRGNCWAVGTATRGSASLNQAMHWNGRRWSLVPVPQPAGVAGLDFNQLSDVLPGGGTVRQP